MKHLIQVRQYPPGETHHTSDDFTLIETVHRVLRAESIGNFNPVFCRYQGNPRVLVHSDDGDVSDPFRGTLTNLFIEIQPTTPIP